VPSAFRGSCVGDAPRSPTYVTERLQANEAALELHSKYCCFHNYLTQGLYWVLLISCRRIKFVNQSDVFHISTKTPPVWNAEHLQLLLVHGPLVAYKKSVRSWGVYRGEVLPAASLNLYP
jgi:hypothetical protein